jgi:formate dehydrogenase maturation protein FdhE
MLLGMPSKTDTGQYLQHIDSTCGLCLLEFTAMKTESNACEAAQQQLLLLLMHREVAVSHVHDCSSCSQASPTLGYSFCNKPLPGTVAC